MRYPLCWDVMQCHMPEDRLPHAYSFRQFGMIPMFHATEITKEMVLPSLFLSCKADVRAKRKDEAQPALFLIFVLFYVYFVLFYVFLCCSVYCLFCVVFCIVCVYMCTELLPPGGNPIAVKYIIYRIDLRNCSYLMQNIVIR
jgi:hypothetical protein